MSDERERRFEAMADRMRDKPIGVELADALAKAQAAEIVTLRTALAQSEADCAVFTRSNAGLTSDVLALRAELAASRAHGVSFGLHLASIISHWDEFGPEHGFDETIEAGRTALQAQPKGQGEDTK